MNRKRWFALLVFGGLVCSGLASVATLAEENATGSAADNATDNATPPASTSVEPGKELPSTTSASASGPASEDDSVPQAGNLKKTMNQAILQFKPSEEIDVDRPVDFPTNI